jgi:hypothetical protein
MADTEILKGGTLSMTPLPGPEADSLREWKHKRIGLCFRGQKRMLEMAVAVRRLETITGFHMANVIFTGGGEICMASGVIVWGGLTG